MQEKKESNRYIARSLKNSSRRIPDNAGRSIGGSARVALRSQPDTRRSAAHDYTTQQSSPHPLRFPRRNYKPLPKQVPATSPSAYTEHMSTCERGLEKSPLLPPPVYPKMQGSTAFAPLQRYLHISDSAPDTIHNSRPCIRIAPTAGTGNPCPRNKAEATKAGSRSTCRMRSHPSMYRLRTASTLARTHFSTNRRQKANPPGDTARPRITGANSQNIIGNFGTSIQARDQTA